MKRFLFYASVITSLCNVNLFSQIIPLPVELVYFNYQILDSTKVLLNWGTATEVDNYGFNVEKYSDANWGTLVFIPGHGNSNVPNYYSCVDSTINMGKTFLYRLKQIDVNGGIKYSDTLVVTIISGIKKENSLTAKNFFVAQNFPNPFNPSTNIRVEIPERSEIVLCVYNTLGNLIIEKNYGEQSAGVYSITFDGSKLSSGVYYYTILCGKYSQTKPMVLLK